MQANNPDPAQLPQGEVLGITAILLTCSYNTKVRLGTCRSAHRHPRDPAALCFMRHAE